MKTLSENKRGKPEYTRTLFRVVLVSFFYFVSGKCGTLLAIPPGVATPFWPPSGIALAAVVLWGSGVWPGIVLGSFFVNITTLLSSNPSSSLLVPLASVTFISAGSTLQALLGAYLIRCFIRTTDFFEFPRDISKFSILSALVCVVAALFGATSLVVFGYMPWKAYPETWLTWWLGDLAGILVVSPWIFLWKKEFSSVVFLKKRPLELVLFFALLLFFSFSIFGNWTQAGIYHFPMAYFTIPFILFAAFKYGRGGVLFSTLCVSLVATWGATQNYGPFVRKTVNETLLLLQAFIGVIHIMGLSVAAEIQDRKKALEKLEESEKEKSAVLESSLDCILTINHEGVVVEANTSVEKVFGYRKEDFLGKELAELIIPERVRVHHRKGLARYLETGESHVLNRIIEMPAVRADGTEFPCELFIVPLVIEGKPPLFTGFLRDVTEHNLAHAKLVGALQSEREAREALNKAHGQLELMVKERTAQLEEAQKIAHLGSWEWDIKRNVVTWSDEMYRLYGLKPGERPVDYETFLAFVHPEDRTFVHQTVQKSYETHELFEFDHRVMRSDGKLIWLHARGAVILDSGGKAVRMTGTGQDITARKLVEGALKETRDQLEVRVEERTQELLSANMSLANEIEERKKLADDLIESEMRYRMLVETSPEAITMTDLNTMIVAANQRAADLHGCATANELIGRNAFDFIAPEDRERAADNAKKTLESGSVRSVEYTLLRKDGTRIPVEMSASLLRDADGDPSAFIGVVVDITERRKTQESLQNARDELEMRVADRTAALGAANEALRAEINVRRAAEAHLRQSEERFRSLVQTIPDIVYRLDADGKFIFINNAIKFLGYEPEELIGRHFRVLLHPKDAEIVSRSRVLPGFEGKTTGPKNAPKLFDERRTGKRATRNLEVRLLPKNTAHDPMVGNVFSCGEIISIGQFDKDIIVKEKKFLGTVGIIRDVTERKRADNALRESEEMLRSLYEFAPDAILTVGRDGMIARVNRQLENMFLYARGDLLGKPVELLLPERFRHTHVSYREQYGVEPRARSMGAGLSLYGRRSDGSEFPVDIMLSPVGNGEPRMVVAIVRDITDRKRAEEQLRENEQRFRQLAENIHDIFWLYDRESGNVIYVSSAYENVWKCPVENIYNEPEGWMKSVHPEDIKAVRGVFKLPFDRRRDLEYRIVWPDGSIRWLWDRTFPVENEMGFVYRVVRITHDITDKKFMLDALAKSHHEATLGRLAGMVAHQVNNPLAAMKAGISLLNQDVKDEPQNIEKLNVISDQVDRISRTVRTLLGFVRQRSVKHTAVDIGDVLRTVIALFEGSLRTRGIHLEVSVMENIPPLRINADDLQEIFVNLIENAREALESGRCIFVSVRAGLTGIEICLEDNGAGLGDDPERLFQPFHTTKTTGTGLGLTIVRRMCESYGGNIVAENKPESEGGGARFKIYLPWNQEG